MNIEAAKSKYRFLLKTFIHLDPSSKEHDRTYYKLSGMESIFEALGININEISEEVYDESQNYQK
jgi:hypothetical protein